MKLLQNQKHGQHIVNSAIHTAPKIKTTATYRYPAEADDVVTVVLWGFDQVAGRKACS